MSADTVTIVLVEGRRMMRLSRALAPDRFNAVLGEYQRLLQGLFEAVGGREIKASADTAIAAFATPRQAALAAVAAQQALAAHEWPDGLRLSASVAVDCGQQPGIGFAGLAAGRCAELCDAAEGGQIFVSRAAARMLEQEGLGELVLRDLGEQRARRTGRAVRAYELVVP